MTILIVDDHPEYREILAAFLKQDGHAVIEAGDGIEALGQLGRESVDAIVSDVLMPNMDGFRLCIEVRKHPRLHHLPFVFYTGTYGSASDRALAEKVGADGYLVKPAPPDELLSAVERAVRSAQANARPQLQPSHEADIVKHYNVALVAKLEQRNAELEQSNAQLRAGEEMLRQAQKLEAIGTLAGGIAHDFNNVLAAITGYTELARMECDNPHVLAHLDAVTRASARAVNLVKQILAFSRQEKNERKPIQLASVVEEVLQLLRATIPSTIVFDVSLPASGTTVFADPNQIHQVMMNLVTNAAHAMRGQPGRLKVAVQPAVVDAEMARRVPNARPGRYVRLQVSDSGHGMDSVTLRRIFEPFFTTKGPGEGTGLGLPVVYGIVQHHEGFVTVESEPGKGAHFFLYFPAQAETAVSSPDKPGAIPFGSGERILVVDDEQPLALMTQKMLTFLGYRVQAETSADTALEAFRQDPHGFDVVLTDLTMPGMTGLDLSHKLLQMRPRLPIILISGYTATLTAERVRTLGIREMLQKPLTAQALGDALRRALTSPTHD